MKYKILIALILLLPIKSFAEGYRNSFITVSAMGSLDLELGSDLSYKESKVYQDYYGNDDLWTSYDGESGNYQLDLYIPYRFEFKKRWYLKFGIKGVHGSVSFDETITEGSSDDGELVAGYNNILEYKYNQFGPTVSANFSLKYADFGLQVFTLYGHIYDGKYEALSYMREEGYILDEDDYKTGFDGYNIKVGVRPYASLSMLPFFIYNEFYITYSQIEFDKKLAVYGKSDKEYDMLTFGIGFGLGLYF